ncbi:MAG: DUF2520 domain-containing protein [Paludibacteraceae bacterium]|nr:DUF2520 domain-containing protein [Paludibacteraceae bacterium]
MKIFIIGSGNVATHIALRLKSAGVEIAGIYSKTLENAKTLADKIDVPYTNDKTKIPNANIYICSVKDDCITDVLTGASINKESLLVHTAGSVNMNVLEPFSENIGVIYPMQTFSKAKIVDWNKIPLYIEANNTDTLAKLQPFAIKLSPIVHIATSEQRKILHLAAVFACNFTNELYAVAYRLMTENGLSFESLFPLMEETFAKAKLMPPVKAQTGPAARNDVKVMEMQQGLLKGTDKEIYKLLSKAIQRECMMYDV